MDENKILKWVDSVINGLPVFLENMKDKNTPGRFKYSLTGDISSDSNWGVGNTVFAVKTYFMLNLFTYYRVSAITNIVIGCVTIDITLDNF